MLGTLQWEICLCYIDDILIYSSTVEEHFERLKIIFNKLDGAGLRLKAKKCAIFRRSVKFLGHQVSADGIRRPGQDFCYSAMPGAQ